MIETGLFAFQDCGMHVFGTDDDNDGKQSEFKWLILKRTSLAVTARLDVESPKGTTRLVDGEPYTWVGSSRACEARQPERTGPHS